MIKVTLVGYTPNPLYVCAEAAAVCYDSEPDLKIVKGCIRSGHQSVLEHCSFTFKVEGISRACSHQLVRHRIASYSQQSQRYVTYDDLEWALDGTPEDIKEELEYYCDNALTEYKLMIKKGVKPEDAREVLPNATPTIVYVTFNLRALMHFCNERMCTRAQKEIREVASLMKEQVMWAENISIEEKTILSEVLVPKCEAGVIKACPEFKGCGRHKPLKEFVWRPKAVWQGRDTFLWYCSACGSGVDGNFAFCPCCGAEMTGYEK
jgi:thymidylate synthase (FAD)